MFLLGGQALADCACVNRDGHRFELGQVACLTVDGHSYMAECDMNLNVMSWRKVADSCPQASLRPQTMSLRQSPDDVTTF